MNHEERIKTLIRNRPSDTGTKHRKTRLAPPNVRSTPAATCAKYGRYILSQLEDEQIEDYLHQIVKGLGGKNTHEETFKAGTLEANVNFAFDATPRRTFQSEDMSIIVLTGTPKHGRARLGMNTWVSRSSGMKRKVFAFRLDTMTGASLLVDPEKSDGTLVRRIVSEQSRQVRNIERNDIFAAAYVRWQQCEDRRLNDRWSESRTAGVFDDKKHCTRKHMQAADESVFNRLFNHVEIDDAIDLDEFRRMNDEFERRWDAGELPRIDSLNDFRFRKTMRHRAGSGRAIGLYSPKLSALAIDPRHPESLLHEMAHAYDYEHGQISLIPDFATILAGYRVALADMDGVSGKDREYATTPTEVFARLWELSAFEHGMGGSFIDEPGRYENPVMYAPLKQFVPDFDRIIANIGD